MKMNTHTRSTSRDDLRSHPDEKTKDQDEEAKIGFLEEVVMGTDWVLRAEAGTDDRRSYQYLF